MKPVGPQSCPDERGRHSPRQRPLGVNEPTRVIQATADLPREASQFGGLFSPNRLIQAVFGEIPARSTQNFIVALEKPLIGGLPGRNRQQRPLTRPAPCIWAGGVRVVTPKKTNRLTAIDGMRNVRANEADALHAVFWASYLVHARPLRRH
jgi:hypothetical protein